MVVPSGSSLSGTFLPEADIDLVMFSFPFPCQPIRLMAQLQQDLADIARPGSFQPIPHARVPVLKFVVEPGIQVDLVIDELHGAVNAPSIRALFAKFPILLPAQMFLKCLLHIHELDRPYTGGIASYTLQILLLAFLQFRGEPAHLIDFICGVCRFYGAEFNFALTGIDVAGNGRFFARFDEDKLRLESPATMYIIDPLNKRNVLGHNSVRTQDLRKVFRETSEMIEAGDVRRLFDPFDRIKAEFQSRRRAIDEYARNLQLR
jgi:non-canonical poly(A) RNA polymerase PAPD5/7